MAAAPLSCRSYSNQHHHGFSVLGIFRYYWLFLYSLNMAVQIKAYIYLLGNYFPQDICRYYAYFVLCLILKNI